jgi:ribose 5-phosphate isomerase B
VKIAIGADHRGSELRVHLAGWLVEQEHEVIDFGCDSGRTCDYPDLAHAVARQVAEAKCERGVLIDGIGIGMCIAANKIKSVRAALVHDEIGAELSRRHADANVLCLPADMLGQQIVHRIVRTWLTTEFEGGRHARRVAKIMAIEEGADPTSIGNTTTVSESE